MERRRENVCALCQKRRTFQNRGHLLLFTGLSRIPFLITEALLHGICYKDEGITALMMHAATESLSTCKFIQPNRMIIIKISLCQNYRNFKQKDHMPQVYLALAMLKLTETLFTYSYLTQSGISGILTTELHTTRLTLTIILYI